MKKVLALVALASCATAKEPPAAVRAVAFAPPPERYRAILRTKRPRETLRCNEPQPNNDYSSGRGFMSFPPLADETCTTPFVVILRTAYDIDRKDARVLFDKKAELPSVRAAIKATPALGTTFARRSSAEDQTPRCERSPSLLLSAGR